MDFNFSYDSVDKAILANPHKIHGTLYNVEKYLNIAASSANTQNTQHAEINANARESSFISSDSLSSSSSSNTVVSHQPTDNASRLFEDAINGVKQQQGKETDRGFFHKSICLNSDSRRSEF